MEQGIDDLLVAIEIYPQDAYYHYHLGLMYADTAETDLSRLHLEKAIQLGLDPDSEKNAQAILSASD